MCGIAGILSAQEPTPYISRMVKSLDHRGPDDRGIEVFEAHERWIALGNTRLAIIDLSPAGHMPMHDLETGNWITYNGEIYNFPELRCELERLGHTFRSRTDTEVILKAYAQWAASCVEHLRGMFAFALWDARRQELFLARDRMGEKPLYYAQGQDGSFLFASEVRALLSSGLVEPRLDPLTLRIFLYNGFTVAPRIILKGVRSLLPAHWMRVGVDGQIREIQQYWRLPLTAEADIVTEDFLEVLREELSNAASMRLIADVPVGVFLSGGLDSSLLVGLISRSTGNVHTFSISFAEKAYDESAYARWVAERFQTQHSTILLGAAEFSAWLEDALDGMDQPTYDGLNTYFVARAARESGLKVAISGIGGDELFGGYPYFKFAPTVARLNLPGRLFPAKARHFLSQMGRLHGPLKALHIFEQETLPELELLAAYQVSQALFPEKAQRALWVDQNQSDELWFGLPPEFAEFLQHEGGGGDELARLSHYVLRLFEGERVLRDSDSMSMASSLEIRTVFTDHVFIEKVWKIAGNVRCQGAPNKPFEAQIARPILGDAYPYRRKQGFIFPFQVWLQTPAMQTRIHEVLTDMEGLSRLGLKADGLRRLLEVSSLPWSRLWALYVLARWTDRHQVTL